MSRNGKLPAYSPALLEMLERDGELDRILSGQGLTFEQAPSPPAPPPPQPWHPPPPDWDQEERERLAREREQNRQERERIIAEELGRIAPEDEEPEPLPRRRGWMQRREMQP